MTFTFNNLILYSDTFIYLNNGNINDVGNIYDNEDENEFSLGHEMSIDEIGDAIAYQKLMSAENAELCIAILKTIQSQNISDIGIFKKINKLSTYLISVNLVTFHVSFANGKVELVPTYNSTNVRITTNEKLCDFNFSCKNQVSGVYNCAKDYIAERILEYVHCKRQKY